MATTDVQNGNQERGTALLSQIPFGAVIGGPLKAAVDAQGAAALACYDFISKVGFEEDAANKRTKVRDITFTFERTAEAAPGATQPAPTKVMLTVPLLTI